MHRGGFRRSPRAAGRRHGREPACGMLRHCSGGHHPQRHDSHDSPQCAGRLRPAPYKALQNIHGAGSRGAHDKRGRRQRRGHGLRRPLHRRGRQPLPTPDNRLPERQPARRLRLRPRAARKDILTAQIRRNSRQQAALPLRRAVRPAPVLEPRRLHTPPQRISLHRAPAKGQAHRRKPVRLC